VPPRGPAHSHGTAEAIPRGTQERGTIGVLLIVNDEVIGWNRIKGGQGTIMQRTAGFLAVVWLVYCGLLLPQAVGQETEWQGSRPVPQAPTPQPAPQPPPGIPALHQSAPQVLEIPLQQRPSVPSSAPQQGPSRSHGQGRQAHARWQQPAARQQDPYRDDEETEQDLIRQEQDLAWQEVECAQSHARFHQRYGGQPAPACQWDLWCHAQRERAYQQLEERRMRRWCQQYGCGWPPCPCGP